ncbi:copper resistance protein CopC [Ktedonobacter robiniae]|uniref:CopC domain-containing protein n=1 Tax=Ktedonobacter robiniae TaxID=2778365 RepID=A0ABQ3UJG2_9CHLR|nr:copper resistance protein CopC [Ktedonobacter robiniae]GHO52866.1 hypothetical protein KSB_13410 [Ktedonobacter robiniae]
MQKRRLLVILLSCILALVMHMGWLLCTPPPVAQAHAFVIGSDPVDGSTIAKVPSVAHITFNAPISTLSSAHIYSLQKGTLVDVTDGQPSVSHANPRQLNIPLQSPDSLPEGSYEIKWVAVAANDGQTTNGIIGFDVAVSSLGISGQKVLGPATSNNLYGTGGSRQFTTLSILSVGWDWLVLIALTFWIGLLITENWILARQSRIQSLLERARKRTTSLQWLCLCALLIGECVTFILHVAQMSQTLDSSFSFNSMLAMLLQTTYGMLLIIRLALILVAMGLLYWTRRINLKNYPATPTPRLVTRTGALGSITGSLSPVTGQLSIVTSATRALNTTGASITSSLKQPTGSNPGKKASNPGKRSSNPGTTRSLTHDTREVARDQESRLGRLAPSQHGYAPIWLVLGGLILLTRSFSSEAAQVLQPHASAVLFDWISLVSLGIWLGGLTYLGFILFPLLSAVERDHYADALVVIQRRFTPFQLGSIAALLASGFYLCEASIPNREAFLQDPYGRTLLILFVLLVLMLILSWVGMAVLRPKLMRQALFLPVVTSDLPTRRARQSVLLNTGRTLKQVVSAQSIIGAGVLLCLALLTFYAPPIVYPEVNYSASTSQAASAPATQTRQVGDLSLSLLVTPAKLNESNTVVLTIKDAAGQPVTDAQVTLTLNMVAMDMGTTQTVVKGNDSATYVAVFDKQQTFSMSGVWTIDVKVARTGHDPVQTQFQVNIN